MRHEPLSGWPRRILHAALLAAGWLLFLYWWYEVAVQDWNRTAIALIILVTLIVAPAVTVGWVLHNLSLFRRMGPRLRSPEVSTEYARDWNGRAIVADWRRLEGEAHVVVTVEDGRKLYTPRDAAAAGPGH